MTTPHPGYIHTGTVAEVRGLPVAAADVERCACQRCPEDPLTCPTCSGEHGYVEYMWNECPHTPPLPRHMAWVTAQDGRRVRLVHARSSSLTPAGHQSGNCSP